MQLMLNKNHLSRYSKLGQINSHIWFQNFNWDDLISMNMKPAFMPKLKNKDLTKNPVPYLDFVKTGNEWEELFDKFYLMMIIKNLIIYIFYYFIF